MCLREYTFSLSDIYRNIDIDVCSIYDRPNCQFIQKNSEQYVLAFDWDQINEWASICDLFRAQESCGESPPPLLIRSINKYSPWHNTRLNRFASCTRTIFLLFYLPQFNCVYNKIYIRGTFIHYIYLKHLLFFMTSRL